MGWEHDRFAGLPKRERARWLAFHLLAGDVEVYRSYYDQFKAMGMDLDEFTSLEPEVKRMKMQQALNVQKMKGQ